MTATGAALTVLTAAHRMPPALLLMFTFVLGTGAILVAPAYQSLVPDMVRYRREAGAADVVHFQWLPVQALDAHLLPRRPVVLTAHDLLPREPRPGQVGAQRRLYDAVDALVVHSEYGRGQLVSELGIEPAKVHVVHHGAFSHLLEQPHEAPLLQDLAEVKGPVVLFFGLLRPYKGIEVLLDAWRGLVGAELWIVGRPRMPVEPLRGKAPPGVRHTSGARTWSCCHTCEPNALISRVCWPRPWRSERQWSPRTSAASRRLAPRVARAWWRRAIPPRCTRSWRS